MQETDQGGLATVARETFEHGLVPWAGKTYAAWVRGWTLAHPVDPVGLVQLPSGIYRAYQERTPGVRLSRQTAEQLGYPHVPGEQDLDRVRRELHEALARCDWDEAHDLDSQLRELQEQVAGRVTALRRRPAFGT